MHGYDSWEISPKKKNRTEESINQEKKYGEIAKKRLEELIYDKIIYIKFLKFDKYGRPLVQIYIKNSDDKSINEIMIEENNGKIYDGGSKNNYDDTINKTD